MKAELLLDMPRRASKETVPKGTIIDDPECHWLVRFGCAKPADDECRQAVPEWNEQRQIVMLAKYKKIAKGMATGEKRYDAANNEGE